ncbi:MAG: hypothetical protein QOD86_2331 [Miltoncostaeaceae bacterium]|jgi:hypothetical protein|nr:hypothetical protein [Miltoncostaeaceae bacterium]
MALRRRTREPRPEPTRWTRAAIALHQPEAEMLAGLLGDHGIPAVIRRTTFDVPDMLAGGPRELLVPADREREARELLGADPGGGAPPSAPESAP